MSVYTVIPEPTTTIETTIPITTTPMMTSEPFPEPTSEVINPQYGGLSTGIFKPLFDYSSNKK